jgi:hypothetical protein
VATAKACVAAAELIRRRDERDDVTTTPGNTFLNELSPALRRLCRGDERTSLRRLARNRQAQFVHTQFVQLSVSYKAIEHFGLSFDSFENRDEAVAFASTDYRPFQYEVVFFRPKRVPLSKQRTQRDVTRLTCVVPVADRLGERSTRS